MIAQFTKKLKFKRKIVLVTNGTGVMSNDNFEDVVEKLQELNIELVVMYVLL
jgi:ATP-dependent DNA helicase 2 subunit 2